MAEGFVTPVRLTPKEYKKDVNSILADTRKLEKAFDRISKKPIPLRVSPKFHTQSKRVMDDLSRIEKMLTKLGKKNVQPKINIGGQQFAQQEKAAGRLISKLGALALSYVGVRQAIRSVGFATRVFTELEDNLLGTAAVTNATAEQFGQLSKQARELGASTRFTAGEAAKAQQILTRAGFSIQEALVVVPNLLDLASAGQLDLASATGITANILRAFNEDVGETERIMDVLAFASSKANTTIGDLGEGSKFAAPIFSALGLEIEEMSAGLAVLADRGLIATLGGTGLRISMQSLISPTEQAIRTLKQMGIELEDVDLQGESLVEVVELLASKNLTAAQAFEIFSARGGTAMLNLTGGVEKFAKLTKQLIGEAEGTVNRMAETMESGLGGSTRRLKSATEAAGIAFADGYTPHLIDAQKSTVSFLNANEEALTSFGKLAGVVTSAAAQVVIGNLDLIASFAALLVGIKSVQVAMLATPFGLLVGGAIAAGVALNTLTNRFIKNTVEEIDRITAATERMQEQWGQTSKAISRGSDQIEKRIEVLEKELSKTDRAILSTRQQFKFFGDEVGNTDEQTANYVERLGQLGGKQLAIREQIERLKRARVEANVEDEKSAEIASEMEKALAREKAEAEALTQQVKDLAETEEDAQRVTNKFATETERLNVEISEVKDLFAKGAIGVFTYERAIDKLGNALQDITTADLHREIDDLQSRLDLMQPDIQIRVIIDDDELQDIERRLEEDFLARITFDPLRVAASPVGLTVDAALAELEANRLMDALLPTKEEIEQFGKEYKKHITIAQKLAIEFHEEWDAIADAGLQAAGIIGGAFGEMLEGLIRGIDGVAQGFAQIQAGVDRGGFAGAAQQFGGALQTGQSVFGIGASLGIFDVDKKVSQFGAAHSGDFEEEGAQAGAVAGAIIAGAFTGGIGAPLGSLIGSIIGGLLGGFVNKGADEGLLQLKQKGDEVEAIVTKNQGGLGDILAGVGEMFSNTIDLIESTLGADVILGGLDQIIGGAGISGPGVSLAFKIRDDFIRVFINGLERDFETIEEALNFAVLEALKSASFGEGLGEEVRKVLESGAFQSIEELDIGIAVAKILDEGTTGANQYTAAIAQLNAEHKEITKVVNQFGLSQAKANKVYNDRLNLLKQDIELSMSAALGVQDRLSFAKQQEQAVNALNDALRDNVTQQQAELEALRQREQQLVSNQQTSSDIMGRSMEDLVNIGRDGFGFVGSEGRGLLSTLQDLGPGLEDTQQQIIDLEDSLSTIPDGIDTQAIADAFNLAGRQSGQDLGRLLQEIMGQSFLNAEVQQLAGLQTQAQLAAQLASTQLLLASTELLDATVRGVLETLLVEGNKVLQGLVDGSITIGGRQKGPNRRKQRLEEQRRAAEEAADKLDRFNQALMELELNRASEGLGDLAASIRDIALAGQEALQFGASEADVRRTQQLQLRGEKQDLLDPFLGARGTNFLVDEAEIEQQRLDALERARLLAQAQADLLGVSFDVVFGEMEEVINNGARRMQEALTREMVNAFGLPLEKVRSEINAFKKRLTDLQLAYRTGAIDEKRYLDLLEQIGDQQTQAVGGSVLSLTEKFYSEIEGGEELRRALIIANFEMELAQAELRFNLLVAEGVLVGETAELIGGLITFMRDNPPDFDEFFELPKRGASISRGSISSPSFGAPVTNVFEGLINSIKGFLTSFDQVDVGRFESQAIEWVGAFDKFQSDIDKAFTSGEISPKEFLELVDLSAELESAKGLAPEKLLNMYKGTLEVTNQLAQEYMNIGLEFQDISTALMLMGASAEQLADAEQVHIERLEQFFVTAFSGIRRLEDRLRGGQFGGVSAIGRVQSAEDRVDELLKRIAEDPLDFEALSEIDKAIEAFIEAQREFTGGEGAEFTFVVDEMLKVLEGLQPPDILPEESVMARMDVQTNVMRSMQSSMEVQNKHASDMVSIATGQAGVLGIRHQENIAKMDEAIDSNEVALSELKGSVAPPG